MQSTFIWCFLFANKIQFAELFLPSKKPGNLLKANLCESLLWKLRVVSISIFAICNFVGGRIFFVVITKFMELFISLRDYLRRKMAFELDLIKHQTEELCRALRDSPRKDQFFIAKINTSLSETETPVVCASNKPSRDCRTGNHFSFLCDDVLKRARDTRSRSGSTMFLTFHIDTRPQSPTFFAS